jgi:hypothetical protein
VLLRCLIGGQADAVLNAVLDCLGKFGERGGETQWAWGFDGHAVTTLRDEHVDDLPVLVDGPAT